MLKLVKGNATAAPVETGAVTAPTRPDAVPPEFRTLDVRQIGDYKCRACDYEWTAPWGGTPSTVASACPRCHKVTIFLKDDSVRFDKTTRV